MKTSFDDAGLKRVRQVHQRVTLVRDVDVSVGPSAVADVADACSLGGDLDVAWQAFDPHQSDWILWGDDVFAYMSTRVPAVGGVILMNATLQVAVGARCVYKDGSLTRTPGTGGTSIVIVNQEQEPITAFGLAQGAEIDGTLQLHPLCIVPVLRNQSAYFTPRDGVRVFVSSAEKGGTIIPPVGDLPTFKRDDPLVFDDGDDTFHRDAG